MIYTAVVVVAEVKQKCFRKISFIVVPELQTMVMISPTLLLLLLLLHRRLPRGRATRDTDKPEIQRASESKSLHSCALS